MIIMTIMIMMQAMEMHKRKAIESAQSAADLKLHLEKYHSQIKEVFIIIIIVISIIERILSFTVVQQQLNYQMSRFSKL